MENADVIYEGGCVVSTFAGTGEQGHREGSKSEAQFDRPTSIALDKNGRLYITDVGNGRLREINVADGAVRTVAVTSWRRGLKGGPSIEAMTMFPFNVKIDLHGDIALTGFFGDYLEVFSPTGNLLRAFLHTPNPGKTFADYCDFGPSQPQDFTLAADGGLLAPGAWGEALAARFNCPWGVARNSNGDTYVADCSKHRIRKIDAHTKAASTVAGTGMRGWRDGSAADAQFNAPAGVAVADDGCVYISDRRNSCIRKLDPVRRRVVTVAGSGEAGFRDGEGNTAQFRMPDGLAVGRDGVLYVADDWNHRIRALSFQRREEQPKTKRALAHPDRVVTVPLRLFVGLQGDFAFLRENLLSLRGKLVGMERKVADLRGKVADLQGQVADLERRLRETDHKEVLLCDICHGQPRQAVFIPCGHFAYCFECASNVRTCPFCSAAIRTLQRVYIV
eukprot:GEMP01013863.1.p1 GENE.GEMP01013863.1~~GEMP01013863.1.p1  ORF type:complete len:448 (+),score=100.16 GEMP01013863.1:147-1490(+)